jgi:hypothetical protein
MVARYGNTSLRKQAQRQRQIIVLSHTAQIEPKDNGAELSGYMIWKSIELWLGNVLIVDTNGGVM